MQRRLLRKLQVHSALLRAIVLIVLTIPAMAPLLLHGLTDSLDGRTHLLRLGVLTDALAHGSFFPRWLPQMQLGHGYPLFIFYPPGSYYLTLLPTLLGVSLYWSYVCLLGCATVLAAFGAAYLTQDILQTRASWAFLLGGVVYSYLPYRLISIYVRGSLPEAVALALLPWVLWSCRRILIGAPPFSYVLLTALFLGGLALSHSLTLLLAIPYLLLYLGVVWWRNGRSMIKGRWLCLALLAAMGVSAFFWLPMLANRADITQAGFTMAREGWLPGNVWRWHNFLDRHLFYDYEGVRPIRVGVTQLLLAVIGFGMARRRTSEWYFLLVAAILLFVAGGAWALPIWQSNDILTAVQYPWRLLALIGLSLTLLTAGIPTRLTTKRLQFLAAAAIMALVIVTQRPHAATMTYYSPATMRLDQAVLAQTEIAKGILTDDAASSVQEFRPRWANDDLQLPERTALNTTPVFTPTLVQAGFLDLALRVTVPQTTTLRFQDFYFPGWQLQGKNNALLAPYPSTALGLLTVDLPPGDYELTKEWGGPPWAGVGALITLLTLLLLTLGALSKRRRRWFAFFPLLAVTLWIAVWWHKPTMQAIQQPPTPVAVPGLRLLGWRAEPAHDGTVRVHPYWYVTDPLSPDLRFRWQLRTASGTVVQEYATRPYFQSSSAANWPPNTLVADAVDIVLPEGLAAGSYQLALGVDSTGAANEQRAATVIGTLVFANAKAPPVLAGQIVDARLGPDIRLAQAAYAVDGKPVALEKDQVLHIEGGQWLSVKIDWQTATVLEQELHGFVHLVDQQGHVIAAQDQSPGQGFQPTALWLPGQTVRDEYLFLIPSTTPSTLLWPLVGLYDSTSHERLRLPTAQNGDDSAIRLAPIKVFNQPKVAWNNTPEVRFGEFADLAGVTLTAPAPTTVIQPGEAITVTLGWRSKAPTEHNFTRFVHLYSPTLGLAGQADGIPQQGNNPTWTWAPGEMVADQLVLTVNEEATAGEYQLLVGFYDAANNGERVPVSDQEGNSLPDNVAPIAQLTIAPMKVKQ